jgi:type I restriction enzyme R subunit
MLMEGFILKREDRNQKDIFIELLDYSKLKPQRRQREDELYRLAV